MGINNLKRDILKEQTESLEDLELYIKTLSDFLPLPACYITPPGIVLDINKAFEEFSGYSLEEILRNRFLILFKDKKKAERFLKKTLAKEKLEKREITFLTKGGKEIPVNLYSQVRKDKKGVVLGFFLAFIDITKEKSCREELEKKIGQRTKELREKLEELERFHKLAVGRELKMVELKKEMEKLKRN